VFVFIYGLGFHWSLFFFPLAIFFIILFGVTVGLIMTPIGLLYNDIGKIISMGLSFFTVYGPWGRPEMAMFLFTEAIINNQPIKVFNNGYLSRNFTYIDDIITGILATLLDTSNNKTAYKLYNIGNSHPL